MKKAGRPKETNGMDLISLDECIKRAEGYLGLSRPPWSKRTLQNKLSKGEFQRYGTYHCPQVDWDEVRRSLHWRRRKVVA